METVLVFTIGLLYVGFLHASTEADHGQSVCLTRIVQLVDTIRLDFEDPTWSNIDVAIWNIIESHIGAVAANIPLMGPLATLLAKKLRLSATALSSKRSESGEQSSSKYASRSHRGIEHGFKRMNDGGSGNGALVGLASSTTGTGVSELDEEMSNMDHLGKHKIMVKTDLEQSFGDLELSHRPVL